MKHIQFVPTPGIFPVAKSPLRFAVIGPNGHLSSSWKVELTKSGEVYVFKRDREGEQHKVSLHKSGACHIKCQETPRVDADIAWQTTYHESGVTPLFNVLFTKFSCNIDPAQAIDGVGQWREKPTLARLEEGHSISLSILRIERAVTTDIVYDANSAVVAEFDFPETREILQVIAHRIAHYDLRWVFTDDHFAKELSKHSAGMKQGEELEVDLYGTTLDGPGNVRWMSSLKLEKQ